jgi:predicted Zn-dependent protease
MQLVVSSVFGRKQGTTTINEYDDASLQKVVQRAEELARLAPDNPEYMPFLPPQTYGPAARTFIPATEAISSKLRADLTAQSLQIAKGFGTHRSRIYREWSELFGKDELTRIVDLAHGNGCRFLRHTPDQ